MTQFDYLPWARPEVFSTRPCVRDDVEELTYAQFAERVEAVAEQYAELGIGPGDVVAIMLPNRIELLLALMAAWRVGAAATPVNPAFTANEADYQITDAGARLLITVGGGHSHDDLTVLDVEHLRRTARGSLPPATTDGADLALLVYTSGSTGRPKGVMLDHRNVEAMTASMLAAKPVGDDTHCLLFLPLFHANALFVSFLTTVRGGGQLSVMRKFTVPTFIDWVQRLRPTFFSGVPAIYAMLVAHAGDADFSSVRYGVCGAAPASAELLTAAEHKLGFPLVEGYGLTEGSCASCTNPVDGVRKLGTVGPAMPGQRVEVMDEHGTILAPGERGEVVIKGANVMVGYLNRPEATAATLRDGWLRTGDVGVIDEDGYLRIVDRIKDMIIRGGENIYPKEIEAVLHTHPGVLEAAVVGAPHDVLGEVPVAFVAAYPDADLVVDDMLATCYANLAKFKVPVSIRVLDEIPRNPVGKVDKPTLRSREDLRDLSNRG
ncbi:class I adenylate-forming enzyme family protein [Nocardia lasii]|uniref:Class I adenylate-forming enzyme family protein n=1 Tax=Nocardia lasii TaxID=1616107 RepID=A0ABW1JPG3_9NOCA